MCENVSPMYGMPLPRGGKGSDLQAIDRCASRGSRARSTKAIARCASRQPGTTFFAFLLSTLCIENTQTIPPEQEHLNQLKHVHQQAETLPFTLNTFDFACDSIIYSKSDRCD